MYTASVIYYGVVPFRWCSDSASLQCSRFINNKMKKGDLKEKEGFLSCLPPGGATICSDICFAYLSVSLKRPDCCKPGDGAEQRRVKRDDGACRCREKEKKCKDRY